MTRFSFASFLAALILLAAPSLRASVAVYDQPHDGGSTLYQSSWWSPDDSDWDQHVWDSFTLSASQAVTEIRWRGGYIYNGQYSPTVSDFTVAIYANSIANEPDIINPPLMQYQTGGNAGQVAAGTFGGVAMYDYHFTLPAAFQATGGVKYWVCILAAQSSIPEWALARGSGGNGQHFRWLRGAHMYQFISGDAAFTLYGSEAPTFIISASAIPMQGGTISGAGAYPAGSSATLAATPNGGYAFVDWTESGTPVSNAASYTFTVSGNRALIARFTPAYAISTGAFPTYGGTTVGDGTFTSGSVVTVHAAANMGFIFAGWTEFGSLVSDSATYAFTATADRNLVATFANDPLSVTYDFDNAPQFTSLPIDLTVDGLTAHLTATGSGFSIQAVGALGISPAGFSGLCLSPNSVFPADLVVDFSAPLSDFWIMYSPQELGCDTSATMRVTTYLDGSFVSTATATAPNPGTYPTGMLGISAPSAFNRAVVHYDAAPATCQDWGPIFFADNMTVTRLPMSCPADATGNGVVDIDDLFTVINHWGPYTGTADINANGVVDVDDLFMVINAWGACQ